MKNLFLISLMVASAANADLSTKMTQDLFLKNLSIQVQSFVTNIDGTRILEVHGAQQTSRFAYMPDKKVNIEQSWATHVEGLPSVYITYNLIIDDNMTVHIDVAQYESLKPKPTGLIRKASLPVVNFGSVSWVAKVAPDKNVVIRFSPNLPTRPETEQLKYPVIALTDATGIDNANRLWTSGVGGAGAVIALGSPYGRLFVSFIPFKGSREIGFSTGDQMEVNVGGKKVVWIRSHETIVAGGIRAKVYGFVQDGVKEPAYAHSISVMPLEEAEKEAKK